MNGMFGVATGQQIENELRHDANAWGEAFALAIPCAIGALFYQLNPWAGCLSGLIILLLELYLFKVYALGIWKIWQPAEFSTSLVRDLQPGQLFTASPVPPRCSVVKVKVRGSTTTVCYTYAAKSHQHTFSSNYRVRLISRRS